LKGILIAFLDSRKDVLFEQTRGSLHRWNYDAIVLKVIANDIFQTFGKGDEIFI